MCDATYVRNCFASAMTYHRQPPWEQTARRTGEQRQAAVAVDERLSGAAAFTWPTPISTASNSLVGIHRDESGQARSVGFRLSHTLQNRASRAAADDPIKFSEILFFSHVHSTITMLVRGYMRFHQCLASQRGYLRSAPPHTSL